MIFCLPALAALSLSAIAFASPTKYGGNKCGNHLALEHINAKESKFANDLSRVEIPGSTFSDRTISVYFNVISSGTDLSQGCIPYVGSD
jgi:hypothetical protein